MAAEQGRSSVETIWNPVRGCTAVSRGCERCYAARIGQHFSGKGEPFEGLTEMHDGCARFSGSVRVDEDLLEEPLRWRAGPRVVAVGTLGDLFHEQLSDAVIERVLDVMRQADAHSFRVLTKRARRMQRLVSRVYGDEPAHNVWLGVSVEDQRNAEARLPPLRHTPAALRFVACEPLLDRVDLTMHLTRYVNEPKRSINWVIAGGETGPRARPLSLSWLRELRLQCDRARVPLYIKQLGSAWARALPSDWRVGDDAGRSPRLWPADLRVRQEAFVS